LETVQVDETKKGKNGAIRSTVTIKRKKRADKPNGSRPAKKDTSSVIYVS